MSPVAGFLMSLDSRTIHRLLRADIRRGVNAGVAETPGHDSWATRAEAERTRLDRRMVSPGLVSSIMPPGPPRTADQRSALFDLPSMAKRLTR